MEGSQWFSVMLEELEWIPLALTFLTTYGMPLAFGVLVYLAQSIGLSTIARRRGLQGAWLAWLPIGNLWILGSISDQYRELTLEQVRNKRGLLLKLGLGCIGVVAIFGFGIWAASVGIFEANFPGLSPVAAGLGFMAVFLLLMALWLLLRINAYIALFDLLRSCDPQKAWIYLGLCIFMYMIQPFVVFALRHKDTGIPIHRESRTYNRQHPCEF